MATAQPETAEEILRRMRTIRTKLNGEMSGVVDNARQILDWRYYYQRAPWISLCAALAAGYLLVRRRSQPVLVDPAVREALAGRGRVVVQQPHGMMQAVGGLLVATLVRSGVNLSLHWLGQLLRRNPAPEQALEERT